MAGRSKAKSRQRVQTKATEQPGSRHWGYPTSAEDVDPLLLRVPRHWPTVWRNVMDATGATEVLGGAVRMAERQGHGPDGEPVADLRTGKL